MHNVTIYTDGSARINPGPGGYGVILRCGTVSKELSQGYAYTTNNRMELLAVIVGLEALTEIPCEVCVYSDSKYVIDAVEQRWLFDWEQKGFKGRKNPDLWKRFLQVYRRHMVSFVWLKGHNGHPENERCDCLASAASYAPVLLPDHEYTNTKGAPPNGLAFSFHD
jgi:ribonuclease HI